MDIWRHGEPEVWIFGGMESQKCGFSCLGLIEVLESPMLHIHIQTALQPIVDL